MGLIYKITNKKTGKMYVGQTAYSLDRRWREHKSKAKQGKKNYLLYQAIRKCGIRYFTIEALEQCDNSILDEREVYWINKLGTNKNGYNMTNGGDTNLFPKPSEEEINDWWVRFSNGESIMSISKTTKFHRETISKYLKVHKEYNYIVGRSIRHEKIYYRFASFDKPIYKYDRQNNFIEEIDIKKIKMKPSDKEAILEVCDGKRKYFNHYIYRYEKI